MNRSGSRAILTDTGSAGVLPLPVLWNKKGEEMNSLILNPGSEESLQAGCCCPYMDNGHGRGYLGDGEKFGWVINSACPLHGEGTATWAKWQEEE